MSNQFLGFGAMVDNPCWANPQCVPQDLIVAGCATIRSVGAALSGGLTGDAAADAANMIDWVNAYDITTVPWSELLQGEFTDPSQTTPPSTATGECASPGVCSPQNSTLCVTGGTPGACTTGECLGAISVSRSQYIFFCPIQAYFVIAWGTTITDSETCGDGAFYAARGCIYDCSAASFPLIVDVPIPDNTLDDSVLVSNYVVGIIQSGATLPGVGIIGEEMAIIPNLSSLTRENSGFSGLGIHWSTSIATGCYASPDDPFTDDSPP